MDEVLDGRPRESPVDLVRAGPEGEELADDGQRLPHGGGGIEGSEVDVPVFLLPPGDLPRGWRSVDAKEAGGMRGKGVTNNNDPDNSTPADLQTGSCSGPGVESISGAGNFSVSGGTANMAGLVNLGGTHTFSGAAANLTGNYICTNNTLIISAGTANFSGPGLIRPATVSAAAAAL